METNAETPLGLGPKNPTPEEVDRFWGFARDHVGWATLEGIFGQQQASSVIPPWMHLADSAEEATALATKLEEQGTVEVSSPLSLYPEDGTLPKRGDLAIICDGAGRPSVLSATLEVRVSGSADGAGRIVTEKLRCLYPPVGEVRHPDKSR